MYPPFRSRVYPVGNASRASEGEGRRATGFKVAQAVGELCQFRGACNRRTKGLTQRELSWNL